MIAQRLDTIPIKATVLSPLKRLLKSNFVKLNAINNVAIAITMILNIFISNVLCYIKRPLTLLANNFTAIAKRITPNIFLIIPSPF